MTIEYYIAHLLSSPDGNSCVKAGAVLKVSHDQVTRLLNNESFTGADLFAKAAPALVLGGGTLHVDDSVIDKPYSDLQANDFSGISMIWKTSQDRSRHLPDGFALHGYFGT